MTTKDGDLKFEFRTDDAEAVKVAMERFDDLVKNQKMWAAEPPKGDKPGRVLQAFDPEADVVFMRQLQGG